MGWYRCVSSMFIERWCFFSSSSKMLLLVFTSFNWWLLIAANISGIILHLSSKPVRMSRKKNHCRKILAFASENDEIKKNFMHWSNQRNEIRYIQLNPSENYSHFSNLEIFHFNVIIHNDGLIYSLKKSAEYFKRIVKYFIWDGWRRRANEIQREREREIDRDGENKNESSKIKSRNTYQDWKKKHTHHAPTTTNQYSICRIQLWIICERVCVAMM